MHFTYKLIPKTLLARFLLIITIPTIIGQAIAIYLFYDRHWYNVSHYTSGIIARDISLFIHTWDKGDLDATNNVASALNISYSFCAGELLANVRTPDLEELDIFQQALTSKIPNLSVIRLSPDENRVMVDLGFDNGVMHIQFPSKPLMNPTTYIFVSWILLLTLLLLATSLIFSKNQLRSILELTKAADEFGRGIKMAKPYKPSGAAEVRLAGMAFIRMRDRIERQIAKRTQMLAMISHDLRTPLTRIKLQLELMDQSEAQEEIASDVHSMMYMIASYLDFARGEGGEEFITVSICAWLQENIMNIAPKTLAIEYEAVNQDLILSIKPQALKRAIVNLLDNAARYASKVKISVYKHIEAINIEIEDNGQGISDSEKFLVFKPFYRSDKARHIYDTQASVGLGLAITQEIIQGHNGNITMMDGKTLGGLLVRISLPI